MIEITKDEAESLLDFIESNFYEVIRNDVDIDNINWAANIMSLYQKCKEGCAE